MQYENEIALGIFASLVGIGLAVRGLGVGAPPGGGPGPLPGEKFTFPLQLSQFSPLTVSASNPTATITLTNPTVQYNGPGRNTYTYFEVRQAGKRVMASGIAGAHVGPPNGPSAGGTFPLVAPNQPQPCNAPPAPVLIAAAWQPGTQLWPCGEQMQPGLCGGPLTAGVNGDLYLMIFQDQSESGQAVDADGFSSPSCNLARVPIATWVRQGAVTVTS